MGKTFDFCGWATKNDIRCSDGLTIRKDAFKAQNGEVVPLVYRHQHDSMDNVLGHAVLENRDEGVYMYGYFNDSKEGKAAKERVKHGDITQLSIYANQLEKRNKDVMHGMIREVSLVLAGANPGAKIERVSLEHSDGTYEDLDDEFVFYPGLEIEHEDELDDEEDYLSQEDDFNPEKVYDSMSEEQKALLYFMIAKAKDMKSGNVSHEDELSQEDDGFDAQEVYDSLTDEQKEFVHFMLGEAVGEDDNEAQHEDDDFENDDYESLLEDDENEDDETLEHEGGNEMKNNIFEQFGAAPETHQETLTAEQSAEIFHDAMSNKRSLRDAFVAHSATYGIDNIEYLFPEAKSLDNPPSWIKRDTGWVSVVMNGVHHTPFSRIKSMHANITADDARAKGYIKGNQKTEEVFPVLRRTTEPQMIYKKQKMDRDDIIDITDFDVVAWIKAEMRLMLDEEIARAILIGDGRSAASDDKIKEDRVRPIWKDDALYVINAVVEVQPGDDPDAKASKFIRKAIKARKDYKGAGNPTLFTTEDLLTDMLLLTDLNGRDLYDSVEKLATKLRVAKIVTVPVMENQTRSVTIEGVAHSRVLAGLIVNLQDYNVGADKGGAIKMFEDFDIDFNQEKYLIETKISGAMVTPYGAMAVEFEEVSG